MRQRSGLALNVCQKLACYGKVANVKLMTNGEGWLNADKMKIDVDMQAND